MMQIYVPTRSRAGTQITLANLPTLDNVTIVVNYDQVDEYYRKVSSVNMLVCPPDVDTIGKVRQFICTQHDVGKYGPKLLMLDDDLKFFARRTDDPTKFRPINGTKEVDLMIKTIDKLLDGYAHAGILAREGGNRVLEKYEHSTRLLRALAYRVDVMRKHDVRFDRLIVMEDFDVALQLLELGYPNVRVQEYVQDQTRSNAPGGCSTYRTLARQEEGALGLARLHPPFVTVVHKQTKTAWNGQERTDVMIAWKKATLSYKGEERSLP